jgi:hypothetical protein
LAFSITFALMTRNAFLLCFDAAAPALAVAVGNAVVMGAHHHHHLWEAGHCVSDAD